MIGKTNAIALVSSGAVTDDAFKELINGTLTAFVNPSDNTKIMSYKFYNMTDLKSANLNNVTNLGDHAFSGSGITSITIPSSITTMGSQCFRACTSLLSATVNTPSVSDSCFYDCSNLTTASLSDSTKTISKHAFYNCSKIETINLNKITDYGSYSMYKVGMDGSSDIVINSNDSNGVVISGNNAFEYAKIKSVTAVKWSFYNSDFANSEIESFTAVILRSGGYIFQNSKLKNINLLNTTINSVSNYFLYGARKVEIVNFSNCNFKAFGSSGGQFYLMGSERDSLNQTIELDFINSTFNRVYTTTFHGLINTRVVMPSSLAYINATAFSNCNRLQLVLNSLPSLVNSNAFNNNNDLQIFVNYTDVPTLKGMSNWAAYAANIFGKIEGSDVINNYNGVFPDTIYNGNTDICWFSDTTFKNYVSSPESNKIYYYKTGPVYLSSIASSNGSVTVSDGINTYSLNDAIKIGTQLTITFTPDSGYTPYAYYINGELIYSTDDVNIITSYNTVMTNDLSIMALYWDGINVPIDSVMANNTWAAIKEAVENGLHRTFNWLGQTKIVTINGVDYPFRLVDDTSNRYTFTNSGQGTNAVFEMVNNYNVTKTYYSTSQMFKGMFNSSTLCSYINSDIYNALPSELQTVLADTTYSGYSVNANGITTGSSKLFLPSTYEYTGIKGSANSVENTTQYSFYANITNYVNPNTNVNYTSLAQALTRGKQSTPTTPLYWWTRSIKDNINACAMSTSGANTYGPVYNNATVGFSLAFAF